MKKKKKNEIHGFRTKSPAQLFHRNCTHTADLINKPQMLENHVPETESQTLKSTKISESSSSKRPKTLTHSTDTKPKLPAQFFHRNCTHTTDLITKPQKLENLVPESAAPTLKKHRNRRIQQLQETQNPNSFHRGYQTKLPAQFFYRNRTHTTDLITKPQNAGKLRSREPSTNPKKHQNTRTQQLQETQNPNSFHKESPPAPSSILHTLTTGRTEETQPFSAWKNALRKLQWGREFTWKHCDGARDECIAGGGIASGGSQILGFRDFRKFLGV